jgi:hypothetical protein
MPLWSGTFLCSIAIVMPRPKPLACAGALNVVMDGSSSSVISTKLEADIAALPADEQPNYKASQVKEKFGTLRFYLTMGTD